MESQEKGVEFGIVAGGSRNFDDLRQSMVGNSAAGTEKSPGLRNAYCRVVGFCDEAVCGGVSVEASKGGDEVFGGRATSP
jgi:hypothetical protein